MIEIPLTAAEFTAKAHQLEEQEGIKLSGPEGTLEHSGVRATYSYAKGLLSVDILEKPFFVSTEFCEEQLRAFLGK